MCAVTIFRLPFWKSAKCMVYVHNSEFQEAGTRAAKNCWVLRLCQRVSSTDHFHNGISDCPWIASVSDKTEKEESTQNAKTFNPLILSGFVIFLLYGVRNFIVTTVVFKYYIMATEVEIFGEFVTESDIRKYHVYLWQSSNMRNIADMILNYFGRHCKYNTMQYNTIHNILKIRCFVWGRKLTALTNLCSVLYLLWRRN